METTDPLEVKPEFVPDEQVFYIVATKYENSNKIYLSSIYTDLEQAVSHLTSDSGKRRILKIVLPTDSL